MDSIISVKNIEHVNASNDIALRNACIETCSTHKQIRDNVQQNFSLNQNQLINNESVLDESSSTESLISNEQPNSCINEDSINPVILNLANSGIIGMAAATAILSARRRTKNFKFESNPSIRRRLTTRLYRKIQSLMDELSSRVGQQAVLILCTPRNKQNSLASKMSSSSSIKIHGTSPLQEVLKNHKSTILEELENCLLSSSASSFEATNPTVIDQCNNSVCELPPLVIDGIPTSLDKMTQAQLRTFIPGMLRSILCRGKPGWGRIHTRPIWWPTDVPWANVRNDIRTLEEKQQLSWTFALRKIVRCCYQYYGREDLLEVEYNSNPFMNSSIELTNMNGSNQTNNSFNVINSQYTTKESDNSFSFIQTNNNHYQPCSNGNRMNPIDQEQSNRMVNNNNCRDLNEFVGIPNNNDFLINQLSKNELNVNDCLMVNQKNQMIHSSNNRIQHQTLRNNSLNDDLPLNTNIINDSTINRYDHSSVSMPNFSSNSMAGHSVFTFLNSNNSPSGINHNSNSIMDRANTLTNVHQINEHKKTIN